MTAAIKAKGKRKKAKVRTRQLFPAFAIETIFALIDIVRSRVSLPQKHSINFSYSFSVLLCVSLLPFTFFLLP
jgi:hypothetical protein